jgi:hypothetical protein
MATRQRQRPGAVTMSAWLVYLAALLNAIQGVTLIIAAARPNRIGGTVAYYSDGYWIFNAVLDLLFAMILAWLGRRLLDGDVNAKWTVMVLAVLDIVFAIFLLPYGVLAIVLNTCVLLMLNSRESRRFFGQ